MRREQVRESSRRHCKRTYSSSSESALDVSLEVFEGRSSLMILLCSLLTVLPARSKVPKQSKPRAPPEQNAGHRDKDLRGEQFFIWFPRWEMLHAHFLEFPKESHPMTWNRAGKRGRHFGETGEGLPPPYPVHGNPEGESRLEKPGSLLEREIQLSLVSREASSSSSFCCLSTTTVAGCC
ncbi:Transferrin Receptor Protein 2 [Manis pentadactyla]|nr:Transferrin Receptor Protein 2 [Manis pentadactyla]